MFRYLTPTEYLAKVPSNATQEQLDTRFWAMAHGVLFMAADAGTVMNLIDDFEIEHNLRAASYIVNDRFELAE